MKKIYEVLKRQWFKIALLVVILLVGTAGAATVITYFNNQAEKERRQEMLVKAEKDREYRAEQKSMCLNIYKQESSKFNNVRSWRYDESEDTCYISYRETKPKTRAQCKEEFTDSETGKIYSALFLDYLMCVEGIFENSF